MALSMNICILISVCFPFSCGIIRFHRFPSVYPFGESFVSFVCDDMRLFSERENKNASLEIQLRRNSNDNWTTVVELNRSSVLWKSENTFFKFRGKYYDQGVTLTGIIQSKQCTVDPKISPDLRCVLSDESGIIDSSSETRILSIEGRTPGNMTDISIVPQELFQDKDEIYFEEDDVLQLQCIAEVENINGFPNKDIRWCKNESGKFQKLSLQHPPLTSIVSRSKDGCSVVQKSVIFYHILQNDTDVDLMCESGYSGTCGKSGINLTISIPTANTNKDKWKVSPIVIHDRESVLNKNLIKLNGAGKTIYLLCTASTLFQQESLQNKMNWCFKRQVNETWTKISPQEKKVEVVSNSSGETTIFSRIKYHVTVLDRDIFFLCEISRYSRCGLGLAHATTNISIGGETLTNEIKEGFKDVQLQKRLEPDCSTAGVAVVSVILVSIVVITFLFLVVLFRRKEIKFQGFVLRIDRPDNRYVEKSFRSSPKKKEKRLPSIKASTEKEIKSEEKINKHCETRELNVAAERQDLYENQEFQQEKNMDTCTYEEVATGHNESEYESLRL
uniref:Ig-like domain-containing protein n=1 Tax=Magallana gigas TaxID=29159 RepID=A0A8W8M8G0_MAGGI